MASQHQPTASSSSSSSRQEEIQEVERQQAVIEAQEAALEKKKRVLDPQLSSYFIAGGAAGAASRTLVSPLERLKIIQQIQPRTSTNPSAHEYRGVWRSLVRMWNEEGFKGFMRGNGINCLRIVPYSAVQFTTYEMLKKFFTNNGQKQLDTPTRLLSGALAGITSVCSTYPLDLVRSRLSIATASIPLNVSPPSSSSGATASASASTSRQPLPQPHAQPSQPALASSYHTSSSRSSPAAAVLSTSSLGASTSKLSQPQPTTLSAKPPPLSMLGLAKHIYATEGGLRALYRGLPATAFGVAPYVGINFAAYEALRGVITPPGQQTIPRKLLCGALAGSISQTLTYPCDVLRRKMQVTGMGGLGVRYTGAFDALGGILRTEGWTGLYRGLWPNLLKVAPSIATSFFTYELVKEFLIYL